MSPRTEEQFEAMRTTRRFQIMENALEVFATEGYHRASIAMIAKRSNISKGLLYNYFESKEDLLKQVIMQGVEGLKTSFVSKENEPGTAEQFEDFIRSGMSIIRTESHFYKLYFRVIFQPEAYHILQVNYREIMGYLLEQVARYFETKGDPHPMEKATLLAALMDGLGIHYLMSPGNYDLDLYQKLICELFK